MGDAVLAEVGSTIYAVFSKVGYCYRIGGDEFCVIAQISDTAAMIQSPPWHFISCYYFFLE